MAPEIFQKVGYSYKADMFSLGSVFFNLLTGRFLFSAPNNQDLLIKNIKCEIAYISKYLLNITPQCKDLLLKMLQADPDNRPSAHEALSHEWFCCDKVVLNKLLLLNDLVCGGSESSLN